MEGVDEGVGEGVKWGGGEKNAGEDEFQIFFFKQKTAYEI